MATASQTGTTMPLAEKIGLAFALLTAIILLGFSFFSLIVDTILQFDLYGILIDLLFLGIGFFLGYFSIRMYKKSVYYESLVNSAFTEGIYKRLEPVLRKIAETSVEMEDVESRLNKIDHMVQTVMEEQVKTGKSLEVEKAIAPGTSMEFVVKTIFLAIITLSGFMVMIETLLGWVHFAILAFYVLWWLFITSEFKLFHNTAAWITVFVPILLIPVGVMILDAFVEIDDLIALFYAFLVVYAFLYFSWAVYTTKGTFPLSLRIRHK
jgi:hypothetical protein